MNDAAVRELWKELAVMGGRLLRLEARLNEIDARIRARLKEEADANRL